MTLHESAFLHLRRHARDHGIRRNRAADHRSGGDDTAPPDMASVKEGDIGSDPAVIFYGDASLGNALIANGHIGRIEDMVLGMKRYMLAHNDVFSDKDRSTRADKGVSSAAGILSES